MDKIKNYTILGLFVLVVFLLLLRQCSPKEVIKEVKTTDTITTIRIDTIVPSPKIVTKIIKKFIPIKIDTLHENIDGIDHINLKKTFIDSLIDSNLVIKWKDEIKGEFINKEISYKLFVPKYITKTITNTITKTDTVFKPYKFSIIGGLEIGGNETSFATIKPFIGVNIKKLNLLYGYNLLNKTHNVGVGYTLYNFK